MALFRVSHINGSSLAAFCPQFFYEATGEEKDLPKPLIHPSIVGRCSYQINTTKGQAVKITVRKVAPSIELLFYETENLYPPGLRDGTMLKKYDFWTMICNYHFKCLLFLRET